MSPKQKQVFTISKPRSKDISSSGVRSRKISLEQAEVATVISGGFNEYVNTSNRPTARESKEFDSVPKDPLIFLDPVTG